MYVNRCGRPEGGDVACRVQRRQCTTVRPPSSTASCPGWHRGKLSDQPQQLTTPLPLVINPNILQDGNIAVISPQVSDVDR